jgi:APA family basic amino acid/polyamine antiporter
LRKTEPDAPRPYKAMGYPWIPALYIIAAALICIDLLFMDARNSGLGLVLVALGFPLYFLVQRLNGSKQ